jgi:hypothetical protein
MQQQHIIMDGMYATFHHKIRHKMWKYLRNEECLKANIVVTKRFTHVEAKLLKEASSLPQTDISLTFLCSMNCVHTWRELTNICAFLCSNLKLHLMKNEKFFSDQWI